jgi:hypothetical protein
VSSQFGEFGKLPRFEAKFGTHFPDLRLLTRTSGGRHHHNANVTQRRRLTKRVQHLKSVALRKVKVEQRHAGLRIVLSSPLAGNEFKRRFSIVGDLKLEFAFVILQASAQQKNIRGIIFYDKNLRGRHSKKSLLHGADYHRVPGLTRVLGT